MSLETITDLNQYLSFQLEEELYALNISQVHSVLDFEDVTKVPRMPKYMRGVINQRGSVVPIVDLKLKFGKSITEKTINSCIVIVDINLNNDSTALGLLADSVREVINLDPGNIESAPKIGTRIKTDFIKGMGKIDEEFIVILDVDAIFTSEELSIVKGFEEKQLEKESKPTVKKTIDKSMKKKTGKAKTGRIEKKPMKEK